MILIPTSPNDPVTGDVGLLKNEDAIKQSVKNIVMTQLGEKFFDPLFGTSSNRLLFENFNSIISDQLALEIEDALRFYEPRVTFDNIDISEDVKNNLLNLM